jgi:hypothetical protein
MEKGQISPDNHFSSVVKLDYFFFCPMFFQIIKYIEAGNFGFG